MAEPEAASRYGVETPEWPETPPLDWVTFHLAHPGPGGKWPWDPTFACFWNERYHLFYSHPGDDGYAFAHVSSTDMVRWSWHPTTLTPSLLGHGLFSGAAVVTKDGRLAIIYHGAGTERNQVAFAEDDLLDTWSTPVAIEPHVRPDQDGSIIDHWDPHAWLDGDTYYAIFGESPGGVFPDYPRGETRATLHRSSDFVSWEYVGPLLAHDPSDPVDDTDLSGPNFFPIGDVHMLLCISHRMGARYYLGRWENETFTPEVHGRLNWHGWDYFTTETLLTPDGRRVVWAWCLVEQTGEQVAPQDAPQRGVQSLPRELWLSEDGEPRMRPLRELETLRADEVRRPRVVLTDGVPALLDGVAGDALEVAVTIRPGPAARVGLRVCCDATGQGGTEVAIDRVAGTLSIGDAVAPLEAPEGDELLRVFVDKHVIEAFAGDRRAMVSSHPYDPSSTFVTATARGGDAEIDVTAWRMTSIYNPATAD